MATLNIGGQRVKVDDSFLKLSPDQQQATVDEIAGSLKPAAAPEALPDPYREAAQKRFDDLKARGVPVEAPLTHRVAQGATLGAADEILAGALTPFEMMRLGTWDPREGYRHAKAFENVVMDDARKRQGAIGSVAEALGGVGSGVGLARSGMTLARPGAGLVGRSAAMSAEGAGFGGVSGFLGGGDTLEDRLSGARTGAAIGGGVGGALPIAGAVLAPVAAPIASSIRARVNPQGVAESQFARAVSESGRTPQEIAQEIAQASHEGQGAYTAADALGNAGQRMLSTVTRAPGAGRQQAVEFLDARQADQGRRVANALTEGLQTPQTAAQLEANLGRQRSTQGNANYGAARAEADAVDVTPAIEAADRFLTPGASRVLNPGSGIADDSIEAVVRRARSYLTDGRSQVSNFSTALRSKHELDNLIENGTPSQQRVLIPIRNALDDQLAAASQPYAHARDTFRRQSQAIEAIPEGRNAATRGRTEDIVPTFRRMAPDQQGGFRTGYADRLIEQTHGAAPGVNKARALASDATQAELAALAPQTTGAQMTRRLGRENTMFETRRQATGGSQTADNLADAEAQRVDPSVMGAILQGNVLGAGANALRNTVTNLSGYTPAVREQLARLLLSRGAGADIAAPVARVTAREQRMREVARVLLAGSGGGGAAASNEGRGNRR